MPETITTPHGVAFRPNLLATTSFDGSIATTYKRTVTDVVCDNTRALALAEQGQEFKVKHSRHSTAQLGPARQALAMVHTLAEDFTAEVEQLCATPVTPAQWNARSGFHGAYGPPRRAASPASVAFAGDRTGPTRSRVGSAPRRESPAQSKAPSGLTEQTG